jgi:putative transposase
MAWEISTVENLRLNLITDYLQNGESMTQLCLQYKVSRKTAYKWLHRYLDSGIEGLKDHSRAPKTPYIIYDDSYIDLAIELKLKHRTWGPKKILAALDRIYPNKEWPSPTRLYEIFKDHHLVTKRRFKNRVPATGPLGAMSNPNDVWATDLKGWFLTGDGQKFEPLTITDCASRFLIKCVYLPIHSVEYVWPIFEEAFHEYGLPLRVRSDNGPPFGTTGAGRLSRLSINLIKCGVVPEWIRPGHPEENGIHERFHLTLHQDIATPPKETLELQIQEMEQFCDVYNFERPHETLEMKVPGDCYQISPRRWDGKLRTPEYANNEIKMRKVSSRGCISVLDKNLFIGDVLIGEHVGLEEKDNGVYNVYYGPIFLGSISNGVFEKPRLKSRRQR